MVTKTICFRVEQQFRINSSYFKLNYQFTLVIMEYYCNGWYFEFNFHAENVIWNERCVKIEYNIN